MNSLPEFPTAVATVGSNATLKEVARLMRDHRVGYVFVVDRGVAAVSCRSTICGRILAQLDTIIGLVTHEQLRERLGASRPGTSASSAGRPSAPSACGKILRITSRNWQ
jgi:CBS domain-containing protein